MDAAALPWSWYTDPEVFRLERERIFRGSWQYAGHEGQVFDPGAYFTFQAGPVPVVVVRDRDGELRAFVNVCRHRGFEVARGSGRRATLQCGYHAWTYGLDGRLRAAPRSDRESEFDPAELSLVRAQVDTWGPFVFVNPDVGAPPLAETLGDLSTSSPADRISRSGRFSPSRRAAPSASSTTSSPRTRTRAGWRRTCSRSTTRSDARTARSSRGSNAGWPRECSSAGACSRAPST